MDVKQAYTAWADTYDSDSNWTRDLDWQVVRQVLAQPLSGTVVETGCGTGKNTSFLAERGTQVLGLDFSPGMLAQARAKVQRENVVFVQADLTRPWPLRSQTAVLVTCNLVLEHIADLAPVFSEAQRVLAPGGHFFICELHPFRQYKGTVANFQQGAETIEIPAFVHHVSDFVQTAVAHGFTLSRLDEWWHEADAGKPPRLISFLFQV